LIARTYQLTPTELRVLLAIIEVGSIPEVAQFLGMCLTPTRVRFGPSAK
jgi:hypothetical protein